ncbi:hypothetical protein O1W68_16650 [Rhodococcus sp. H36-A4]|uniref:hypothetical protein n=1 Tax=Rhodococcus sp. H36-A4 TaxID=3004353 RepID=UPI0022B04C45|nr:hypothetical protein [Rhodococcus sp. H36-A4]MCZ4079580.1 hypothetical protein [Rhodococcus sp. H36-A4]
MHFLLAADPPAPPAATVPLWAFLAAAGVTLVIGLLSIGLSIFTLRATIKSTDNRELVKWRRDTQLKHLHDFIADSTKLKRHLSDIPYSPLLESEADIQTRMVDTIVLLNMVCTKALMNKVTDLMGKHQNQNRETSKPNKIKINEINQAQLDMIAQFRNETGIKL